MRVIGKEEVARVLTYDRCIPIVRDAMAAFSRGDTKQTLRTIIPLTESRFFGVMPGALGAQAIFGAKLISVFRDNARRGVPSHQGAIVLFDPETGALLATIDAGEVAAIRTAAASAAATDALAVRPARRMAILGTGEQALTHARAISHVRALEEIAVWGRSPERAFAVAAQLHEELGIRTTAAADVAAAVADADIVCTVTGASEPILAGAWLKPGAHVNIVGSSYAGPREVDDDLVARARFIVDSRDGVLSQGAEFLHAKASGRISEDHIAGEIGDVFLGRVAGRGSATEVTAYKSLGHIVQDLACAAMLCRQ